MKQFLAFVLLGLVVLYASAYAQVYIPGVEDTLRGKYTSTMISTDEGKTWTYKFMYLGEICVSSIIYPSGYECEDSRIVSTDIMDLHYNIIRLTDGDTWGIAYSGVGVTFVIVYMKGQEEICRWLCHKVWG